MGMGKEGWVFKHLPKLKINNSYYLILMFYNINIDLDQNPFPKYFLSTSMEATIEEANYLLKACNQHVNK
jgi:hypothetical protein